MSKEMEIRIRPIFSTPLLVFTVPDHERVNKELRRAILEREASHPAEADHEVVGWSSPHDMSMFEWAGPVLKDLMRSEEHTSELQSQSNLVCRLLLEKKKKKKRPSQVILRIH